MEIKAKVSAENDDSLKKFGLWFVNTLLVYKYGPKDGYSIKEWADVFYFANMLLSFIEMEGEK